MSGAPTPEAKQITLAETNGRIMELERQRDSALTRCSVLAGEKAEAIDLLKKHVVEVARLNDLLNAPASPDEPPAENSERLQ